MVRRATNSGDIKLRPLELYGKAKNGFIGISMGGLRALKFVQEHPHIVNHLYLIAPLIFYTCPRGCTLSPQWTSFWQSHSHGSANHMCTSFSQLAQISCHYQANSVSKSCSTVSREPLGFPTSFLQSEFALSYELNKWESDLKSNNSELAYTWMHKLSFDSRMAGDVTYVYESIKKRSDEHAGELEAPWKELIKFMREETIRVVERRWNLVLR